MNDFSEFFHNDDQKRKRVIINLDHKGIPEKYRNSLWP